MSFAIASTHEDRVRFVNDLRVITSAVSLGHDETLIAYEEYPEARAAAFSTPFSEHGLIRLAIGLESASDLLADLDAAFATTATYPDRKAKESDRPHPLRPWARGIATRRQMAHLSSSAIEPARDRARQRPRSST